MDGYEIGSKPVSKMSKAEMAQEVEALRNMISGLDSEALYYMGKVGELCRIVSRSNRGFLGVFLRPHFTLSELEVGVEMSEFESRKGRYFRETKIVRFPIGSVSHLEFVSEREEEPEEPDETDKSLEQIDNLL